RLGHRGKPERNGSQAALTSIRVEPRLPEMLAAAISARRTACPPHHLGDQAFKIAGHAQIMSVPAMIGHNIVVGTQISGENDREQFLADTSVNRPVELAGCKQLE